MKNSILVVDDDEAILELHAHKLGNQFKVFGVTGGKAAIDVLRNQKISLILLDQMMPDIDGMGTFDLIKGEMAVPPPVIMMTAHSSSELLLSFMKNGGADFIAKPLDFDILEIKIRRAIAAAKDAAERKIMEKTIARQERLASVGILSEGISHEILNPLNIIGTVVQLMQMAEQTEDVEKKLNIIMDQIKRIVGIINDLSAYAHPRNPEGDQVDIHKALEKAIAGMAYPLRPGVIVKDYDMESPPVLGNEEEICQVFKHILNNAADAIGDREGGGVNIATRVMGNNFIITIKDNGGGITQENIKKIFDPFYTTKDVGLGLGLGLSVAHSIIKAHRGAIEVESQIGEGASFKITLPLAK